MAKYFKEFKIDDSFELTFTEFDTFTATVTKRKEKGCKIIAVSDCGHEIKGFTPLDARVGTTLLVSPIFQFEDGSFYFRCEAIIAEPKPFELIIGSVGSCNSTSTTSEPQHGNVA